MPLYPHISIRELEDELAKNPSLIPEHRRQRLVELVDEALERLPLAEDSTPAAATIVPSGDYLSADSSEHLGINHC